MNVQGTHQILTKRSSGRQFDRFHGETHAISYLSPTVAHTVNHRAISHHAKGSSVPRRPLTRDEFRIAILCALTHEADAVEALFDERYDDDGDPYGKSQGDFNAYSTGRIGRHSVVLVHMPGMGKALASSVAASCRTSYTGIQLALVVGVCGGVPFSRRGGPLDETCNIMLGDVVVSEGIVEFDFMRWVIERQLRKDTRNNSLGRPNMEIRSFLAKMKGLRSRRKLEKRLQTHLSSVQQLPGHPWAKYPGAELDRLFHSTYRHRHPRTANCETCRADYDDEDDSDSANSSRRQVCLKAVNSSCAQLDCDQNMLIRRRQLPPNDNQSLAPAPPAAIHFGLIASGDTVLMSATDRDEIASRENVIAFEMEGAGVWDNLPTVVIKGVCDYADSHKDKSWQGYAAATAAACMKGILEEWVVPGDI